MIVIALVLIRDTVACQMSTPTNDLSTLGTNTGLLSHAPMTNAAPELHLAIVTPAGNTLSPLLEGLIPVKNTSRQLVDALVPGLRHPIIGTTTWSPIVLLWPAPPRLDSCSWTLVPLTS